MASTGEPPTASEKAFGALVFWADTTAGARLATRVATNRSRRIIDVSSIPDESKNSRDATLRANRVASPGLPGGEWRVKAQSGRARKHGGTRDDGALCSIVRDLDGPHDRARD